ncbi:MAG: hypothetical protein AVDCRST_MAG03-943, partial [uncultured Rubrobacteraceae bacterium]
DRGDRGHDARDKQRHHRGPSRPAGRGRGMRAGRQEREARPRRRAGGLPLRGPGRDRRRGQASARPTGRRV